MYKFESLLQKEKIQEGDLTLALRKKISDVRRLAAAIPETEEMLASGNLSVRKKQDLQEKLDLSKQALPQMDDELVEGIKAWIPKREKIAAQTERLKKARDGKNTAGASGAANSPAPAAAAAAAPSGTRPAPVRKDPPPAQQPEKKGIGIWGYVLIGLGALVLGGAAYQFANKRL